MNRWTVLLIIITIVTTDLLVAGCPDSPSDSDPAVLAPAPVNASMSAPAQANTGQLPGKLLKYRWLARSRSCLHEL